MNELIAFISTASHVTNVTKALIQAKTQIEQDAVRLDLNGALLTLQSKIFEVQASYQALLDENKALKEKIVANEQWEQERNRYYLDSIAVDFLAYRLKDEHCRTEPLHWLCPQCYTDGKKSMLQASTPGSTLHQCHRCKLYVHRS